VDKLGYELSRKPWDSDFFGREIYQLSVTGDLPLEALSEDLTRLDEEGVWGVECSLITSHLHRVASLENLGFRLCDSKIQFISQVSVEGMEVDGLPFGIIREVLPDDLAQVEDLTVKALVDNPRFTSRFNDRRLFSREESIRYYSAWNKLAFEEDPTLFAVWADQGEIRAYFTFLRRKTPGGELIFKGGLTAVQEEYRGHGAQNILQTYLFHNFGVPVFLLDSTTQLSNLPVVNNHIKAGKSYRDSALVFYRAPGLNDL
jgi:hypothetical protein